MSLVYDALQVIAATKLPPKEWEMNGRKGTTHSARLAVLSSNGECENIVLKARSDEELTKKISSYTAGKPAKIPIKEITALMKAGDRKPSGYEYAG